MANELRFTAVEPNATVIFAKNGSPTAYSFKYRTDLDTEWQDYVLGTTLTIPSVGGWIEFKNDTETTETVRGISNSGTVYYHFTLNGPKVAASGSITSMLPYSSSVQLTGLKTYAFCALFDECSSLTTAPELPDSSIALGQQCFSNLFFGCSSLTTAPELPWQTLASRCYEYMFYGCSALTKAPRLTAKSPTSDCYKYMFFDCKSLREVVYDGSVFPGQTAWFGYTSQDTAPKYGVFYYTDQSLAVSGLTRSESYVPAGWAILNAEAEEPDWFTVTALDDTTIKFNKGAGNPNVHLEYRVNDGEWLPYALNDEIDVAAGDSVNFRNYTGSFSSSTSTYIVFYDSARGGTKPSGSARTLFGFDSTKTYTLRSYGLYRLFSDCRALEDASELKLPWTTLASNCYQEMFYNCKDLTTAPELPATSFIFQTTQYKNCYNGMFQGCTSLTTAPELPATTLAESCYRSMFKGCTSLTAAPQLPATTLTLPTTFGGAAKNCYYEMFQGCTSLTTASELPAMTLADYCYYRMFHGCKNLADRPELPALTLYQYCYYEMFADTKLTKAGNLPATTLANYCYHGMFRDITSLVETATIAATEMKMGCCQGMYANSAGLRNIAVLDFSHVTKLATDCFREIMVYIPYKEFRMPDCPYVASAYSKICTWGSGGDIYWPYAEIPSGWFDSSGYAQSKTFYYSNPDLDVGAIPRDKTGVPADWTIQYLAPKPSLVFSINGRAVSSLTINGKAVAKLGA